MTTVIVVSDGANFIGGAQDVAATSAIELSKDNNYRVIMFAGSGPIDKKLNDSKVEVICLNSLGIADDRNRIRAIINGIYNFKAQNKLRNLLASLDPKNTIVHIHSWQSVLSQSIFKPIVKGGFPMIVTLHDYFIVCPNGGLFDYQRKSLCNYRPMSLECIKCNCDKNNYFHKIYRCLRTTLQNRYVRNNNRVTYIGIAKNNIELVKAYVSSPNFYRIDNPVQMRKVKNNLDINSNLFVYIGRVSEEKGIDVFCEAIRLLKSRNVNVSATIIGDGPLKRSLESKYTNINFAGWKNKNEVYEILKKARALVLPSIWHEGSPLVLVEALSAGVPCIISDSITVAGELIIDGYNGSVFSAGNYNSLADAIIYNLNYENSLRMKKNILEKVDLSSYEIAKHTAKLKSLYEKLLKRYASIRDE